MALGTIGTTVLGGFALSGAVGANAIGQSAILSGSVNLGSQLTATEGDYGQVNSASVAISAAAGAVGTGVGNAIAPIGQGALLTRAALGSGVGGTTAAIEQVALNALTGQGLGQDVVFSALGGATGDLLGEVAPALLGRLGAHLDAFRQPGQLARQLDAGLTTLDDFIGSRQPLAIAGEGNLAEGGFGSIHSDHPADLSPTDEGWFHHFFESSNSRGNASGARSIGASRETNLPPRPQDSPFYEVAFEARLQQGVHYPGRSDRAHFQEANRQLYEAMQADPEFGRQMEALYPKITQEIQPGKRGAFPRRTPTRAALTWHHHPNREGVMQLVPQAHHNAPGPVQNTLHPDQRGGMENWGGGRRRQR